MDFQTVFKQAVVRGAANPAVAFHGRVLTYAELAVAIDQLGQQLGATTGRRIFLLLPDTLTTYLLHVRLLLDRACSIPVSPLSTEARLSQLLEIVQPHMVITTPELFRRHSCLGNRCVRLVRHEGSHEALVAAEDSQENGPSSEAEESVRLLIFTSGSTGSPKGVCLGERSIISAAQMMVAFMQLIASRRTVITVPLFDYYGMIQISAHLLSGAFLSIGENASFPTQVLHRIEQMRATDLAAVPFTLRKYLAAAEATGSKALQRLAWIQSSSDVLMPDILERAFAMNACLRIMNIYGLTEAGRACYREIDSKTLLSSSIGRPSPGVELLLDELGNDVGEIVLRGPNIMLGYFKSIVDDRIRFDPATEVRTGDVGRRDHSGEILLVGRRDHLINVRGNKIHPNEIERVAMELPDVQDAYAYAEPQGDGDVTIALDVVASVAVLALLDKHLLRKIPRLFLPAVVRRVDQIDRTELGAKVVRR